MIDRRNFYAKSNITVKTLWLDANYDQQNVIAAKGEMQPNFSSSVTQGLTHYNSGFYPSSGYGVSSDLILYNGGYIKNNIIMYVSVTERAREIGLLMSIGARGIDILMQFLIEAIVISITGGLIGVVLGLISSQLIKTWAHWPILISESSIFGYYPAQKASRLNPIEALRYE